MRRTSAAITVHAINTTSPLDLVRPGSRVTIVGPGGQTQTGRCVLRLPTHAVLNMGGRFGLPAVANNQNITGVEGARAAGA